MSPPAILDIPVDSLRGSTLTSDFISLPDSHAFTCLECRRFIDGTLVIAPSSALLKFGPKYATISHPGLAIIARRSDEEAGSSLSQDEFCVRIPEYGDVVVSISLLKVACELSLANGCPFLWVDVLCMHPDWHAKDRVALAYYSRLRHTIFWKSKHRMIFPAGLHRLSTMEEPTLYMRNDHLLVETLPYQSVADSIVVVLRWDPSGYQTSRKDHGAKACADEWWLQLHEERSDSVPVNVFMDTYTPGVGPKDAFLDLFDPAKNERHIQRTTLIKIAFEKARTVHGYSSISSFTRDLYASAFSWRGQACGKAKCTADKPCGQDRCFDTPSESLELLPRDYAVYSAASSETIVSFLKLLHEISPTSSESFRDVVAAAIPPYRDMWRYTFTPEKWRSLLTAVKPAPEAPAGMMWYFDITHPEKSSLQHVAIDTMTSGAGDSPRTTMRSMSESLSEFKITLIVGRWILLRSDGDPGYSDALPAQTVEISAMVMVEKCEWATTSDSSMFRPKTMARKLYGCSAAFGKLR
ncbi:hypothetical protein K466DRAFT_660863 [Polyporus arcularius HHB13444]|uniref:Heterokaryon incompatibility domain-containing protein n=1 Tax=Polyporus arcularius HHB13444 TaxID=1314778 RepID=A0A5C3PMQ2_9APHY|nr:hypothetical protein K466DRAFT_660863 [Polyporus arcularius HHB13444]